MITRTRSLLSVVALALLATSCLDDPVQPEIIIEPLDPAAFEAVSANGRPLPAFLGAGGSAQTGRQLTRASMLLLPPDSLRLILTTRHVAEDGTPGPVFSDTLRARIGSEDSALVLSPMGTYPLLLSGRGTMDSDGLVVLTVEQPLPSAEGAAAAHPLELRLQPTDFRGLHQH